MFISSLWDVKEPTHYSRRAGDEVPGVVAVLFEYMGGWVGIASPNQLNSCQNSNPDAAIIISRDKRDAL